MADMATCSFFLLAQVRVMRVEDGGQGKGEGEIGSGRERADGMTFVGLIDCR